MRRDPRRLRRRLILAIVGVLLLMQLSALMLPRDLAPPAPLSWAARGVLAVAGGISDAASGMGRMYDVYLDNVDAAKELRELRTENAELRFALHWAERELGDRIVIDELLGIGATPWLGAMAKVVYHDVGDRYRTMWVRAPAGTDVQGHGVASDRGLLGRVVRTNGRFGQVLLVQDVESSIDVVSERGIRAIVRGTGGPEGRLHFVPHYEPLQAGESLVTTGRDAAFPPGLLLGTVTRVERDPENIYLSGSVRFAAEPESAAWVRTLPPVPVPAAAAAPVRGR